MLSRLTVANHNDQRVHRAGRVLDAWIPCVGYWTTQSEHLAPPVRRRID